MKDLSLSQKFMYYAGVLSASEICSIDDLKHIQNLIDAEEQGRLLELPCEVGDWVYCIEEDEYSGYLFLAMCGEYCIVSPHYVHCSNINKQLMEMAEDTESGFTVDIGVFHKDKVFLTKEDARAKLKEMEC